MKQTSYDKIEWNYIKTKGASVHLIPGTVFLDSKKEIKIACDNPITGENGFYNDVFAFTETFIPLFEQIKKTAETTIPSLFRDIEENTRKREDVASDSNTHEPVSRDEFEDEDAYLFF